jgi:membrane associated rhomboid family serine protease
VNYALIAANAAIFLMGYNGGNKQIDSWLLYPDSPRLVQFFSSMFLHATVQHVFFNMVFLWVFGNVLNDRLGHVAYLAFYLAGGVLAGVGYIVCCGHAPVLGASGAISAVTGGYLVLFPRARVRVLMILYFITWFDVSSLLFVGFQFLMDLTMTLATNWTGASGGVAYAAHLSGSLFGVAVGVCLLAVRLLPRDEMDVLSLIRHSQRRQRYRQMVSQGFEPFRGVKPSRPPAQVGGGRRWVATRTVESARPDTPPARELELRREIAEACAQHDMPTAAAKYLQLIQIAEDAILSRQNQLDVANQLMADEQHPAAADAYERFLKHYHAYEHTADIHLMLGLLYGRYLHQYDRAEQLLQRAAEALNDERKVQMARGELEAVRQRRKL